MCVFVWWEEVAVTANTILRDSQTPPQVLTANTQTYDTHNCIPHCDRPAQLVTQTVGPSKIPFRGDGESTRVGGGGGGVMGLLRFKQGAGRRIKGERTSEEAARRQQAQLDLLPGGTLCVCVACVRVYVCVCSVSQGCNCLITCVENQFSY